MRSIRNTGKIKVWLISLAAFVVMLAGVLSAVAWHFINRPISLRGAVIQQNEDPKKQSPIMDVQIDADGNVASAPVKSDFSGYFKLTLRPGVKRGHPITIHFVIALKGKGFRGDGIMGGTFRDTGTGCEGFACWLRTGTSSISLHLGHSINSRAISLGASMC